MWIMELSRCRHPEAFYLALNPAHLDYLILGGGPAECRDKTHNHRILRLWALAQDLKTDDA